MLLLLYYRLKQSFLFDLEKLIENWASAVNVVWSSTWFRPLPRIKTSFFLLSICKDELI